MREGDGVSSVVKNSERGRWCFQRGEEQLITPWGGSTHVAGGVGKTGNVIFLFVE